MSPFYKENCLFSNKKSEDKIISDKNNHLNSNIKL